MAVDYTTLVNEMNGAIRWQLIKSAIELKLFDHTHSWQNVETISEQLGTEEVKTELYLDALASCGYLTKYCGRYKNSEVSDEYLTTSSNVYHGDMVLSLAGRRLDKLDDIPELLRNGDETHTHLGDEKVWTEALELLIPHQKAIASKVINLIKGLEGSENFSSMLDLGGGPGFIGQEVSKKLPHIKPTLFDLPKVIKLAEAKATGEMTFIPGNYSEDDIGEGYDIIWASRSLYYAKDLQELICRVSKSLKRGGYFISLHEGLHNEKTEPQEVILNRIGLALKGSDVSFERGDIESAVKGSGLELASVISLADVGGRADIITARKP